MDACHRPPCDVGTPSSVSASAIRCHDSPVARIVRMSDKRKNDALDRIHGFLWQSGMMHLIADAATR